MSAHEVVIQFPKTRAVVCATAQDRRDAVAEELRAARARVEALRQEIAVLARRHDTSALEFKRRLSNGLTMIADLLAAQSRAATTPEARAQLSVVARRVAAEGRCQGRLTFLKE